MTNLILKTGLAALLATCAAGCKPRDGRAETKQRVLMHTSFEELVGWSQELPPTLTTEKVHSGKYAIRVDGQHPYSLSFRTELGNLVTHRPRRFTLSAWVWVPSFRDDAVFVMAISDPGNPDHPIFSKNLFLTTSGPFEKWKQVSQDFDLPSNVYSKSLITIYLWKSSANEPVYADDLQLTELW